MPRAVAPCICSPQLFWMFLTICDSRRFGAALSRSQCFQCFQDSNQAVGMLSDISSSRWECYPSLHRLWLPDTHCLCFCRSPSLTQPPEQLKSPARPMYRNKEDRHRKTRQCTGKDNKLNLCLQHHKIGLSSIGTSKGDRCFKLAAHLVQNNISIEEIKSNYLRASCDFKH